MVKWTHVKRSTAPDGPGPGRPRKTIVKRQVVTRATHEDIARSLWASSYEELFKAEAAQRPEIAALISNAVHADASTWSRQGWRGAAASERHEQLVAQAAGSVAAQIRRLANQSDIPLVVAARSLSWLMTMARSKHWKEEQQLRRLLHRTTTTSILHAMTACAPPLAFDVNPLVKLAFCDQTYLQNQHYGSRRHVRVERLDAMGMRVQTHFSVYVNSVALPVPAALAPLGVPDLRAIVERGPYTLDPTVTLLPALQPAVVRFHMCAFVVRSSARLLQYAHAVGTPPTHLTAAEITNALLRRPAVSPGGKTPLIVLPVLADTDTKKYLDIIKIIAHLTHHLGHAIVLVILGDGQTVLRLRDTKKKYRAAYKHVLIANGHFHSFAHFMFAGHEMFFDVLTKWAAQQLRKVRMQVRVLANLENNNYYHALEFHLSLPSAIYVYLVNHVISPPPHLFLTSPEAYLRQLRHTGGTVLVQYLLCVGAPTLRWQYAGRAGEGGELDKLHALAVHLFRGPTHKESSSRISLYTLMGFHCAHPKLQHQGM